MTTVTCVADIVDIWHTCLDLPFDKIREVMGRTLGQAEYNSSAFYEKFRRKPSRVANYELDELLALVRAYRTFNPECVSAYDAIRLFHLAGMPLDAFPRLRELFGDEEFESDWKAYLETHKLVPTVKRSYPAPASEPDDNRFIVGRDSEVAAFAQFLSASSETWIYEIHGPGGIGKSVVAEKFRRYARQKQLPVAFLNANISGLTPTRILALIAEGFSTSEGLADYFAKFEQEYSLYSVIHTMLRDVGGINEMFDLLGNPNDRQQVHSLRARLQGQGITSQLEQTIANRFALERYLRNAEANMIHHLAEGLGAASETGAKPLTLLIDTYENMESLDDWFCRDFLPRVQRRIRLAIMGRNALTRINFEWRELGTQLVQRPLPELSEAETKAYLRHFGLSDAAALEQIYRYTQGYPLLLVLVRNLAQEVGGWEQIGALENKADRRDIASDLLERILREERVHEVRAFLEKGVVTDWFDFEIVSVVLDVSIGEGRAIYEKLRRHSFVERHTEGLKFHDVIREVLKARLSESELTDIRARLREHFRKRSGRDD